MKRRQFLRSLSLLSIPTIAPAYAQLGAPPTLMRFPAFPAFAPPGARFSVNIPQMIAAGAVQLCPEWCWATSISMIFAFHGHPVDQRRIVAETYGNVVCVPAESSTTIAQDLSRSWVDDNGQPFTSRILAAYDVYNGVYAINNPIIINELQSNRPLLYCNTHHAMVMCSLTVGATPFGPQVVEIDAVDPWPPSYGIHPLSLPEGVPARPNGGQMTFLAAVEIDDLSE